jgi:hypothetical protein
MDIDKQVEQALENLDMMSEQDAMEWIDQQDEEFIGAVTLFILGNLGDQETVQVPRGISEDEFLEWLNKD